MKDTAMQQRPTFMQAARNKWYVARFHIDDFVYDAAKAVTKKFERLVRMIKMIRYAGRPLYRRPALARYGLYGSWRYHTGYGWAAQTPKTLTERIDRAVDMFAKVAAELNVDTIAFTGSSGAAIAFNIVTRCDVGLLYVRKEDENSHGQPIEMMLGLRCHRYMIVDDFIHSGDTVERVYARITESAAAEWEAAQEAEYSSAKGVTYNAPVCVGILLFNDHSVRKQFTFSDGVDVPVFC